MQARWKSGGTLTAVLVVCFFFLAGPLWAQTGSLTLAWNANPETDLLGYHLYYKSQGSGAPYDGSDADQGPSPLVVPVSAAPQITLSGLDPALDYEFAVTAFNANGESGYSTPVRIFSINSQAGTNGSVAPAGAVWVEENGDKTVTITPDGGFMITDVAVDGTSVGAVGTYTFSQVSGNHSLSAAFDAEPPQTYTITASAGSNGSVNPNGTTSVNHGGSQTISITPDSGYQIADVTVDGASVGAVDTYTFNNVTGDHSLNATFAALQYTINASAGSNGSVSPDGATSVNHGGSQTISITPDSGYRIADVTVDGASVGAVGTYTFSNVTGDHSLNATFAALQYTITASAGSNGQVSPNGTTSVNHGGSQTISITPDSGYQIADVMVDGSSVGAVDTYTFSNVTGDHSLNASFTALQYTITASAGSNGSVSPDGTTSVYHGGSQTISITPDSGYQIADITVDGASVGAVGTYTFAQVTGNHTLTATFDAEPLPSYTITSQAGPNGRVTPDGTVSVTEGSEQTITITPDSGYQIADVTVDGASVGAVGTYTFSNVTGDHSLNATFAALQYTITASAGSNGQVSPNGTTSVNHGGSQTITITPDSGYQIADVIVDGASVGAVPTFIFTDISGDHTLNATFAPGPQVDLAGSLTLAWNANPETDLLGYRLYYKSQGSGAPYDGSDADQGPSPIEVPVSAAPQITLSGLDPALDYEFAVTAFNAHGESGLSTPVRIFSISSQADANGSVTPDGPVWVEQGDDRTVTITPEEGFTIADVLVNGVSVGPAANYTFASVGANGSLSATFAADATDSDGDGLTDYQETHTYGTDPYLADSDDDGIDDGEELAYWGENWNQDADGDTLINLLDADADNDGYWDGEELAAFSDPADPGIIPDTTQFALEFGEVGIDHNWQTVTFDGAYTNPVVVANTATYNGSHQSTVRIRNVSSTGFEIRIQEWDYLDGSHTVETVGYLVMESGSHFLDDGRMIIAGQMDTDSTQFTDYLFPEAFVEAPVVMLSVNSFNESDAVTLRIRNIDTDGFQYKLQEQEVNDQTHAGEQVAYIAWEPSQGILDGIGAYEVGHTKDSMKAKFAAISFAQTFNQTPILMANMQSTDGGDTAVLRWQNKDSLGVEVKVEEEKSRDTETSHTTETVGYMVFSAE